MSVFIDDLHCRLAPPLFLSLSRIPVQIRLPQHLWTLVLQHLRQMLRILLRQQRARPSSICPVRHLQQEELLVATVPLRPSVTDLREEKL
ncbi:MAG: hypothetical protein CM1200mP30_19900 [Pseudomonadota bacterium]|nr:MAG: hypothetical protein CM1200mP30_19900 [Pseudomonadota bacterium]